MTMKRSSGRYSNTEGLSGDFTVRECIVLSPVGVSE
jgi:hypothetical protein